MSNPIIQANDIALFGSTDDRPFFALVGVCTDLTLFDCVYHAMFCTDEVDERHREEIEGVIEELREKGQMRFEDGWLAMRRGISDAVKFVVEKVDEQIRETEHAEKTWREHQQRAEESDARYRVLRGALLMALSDKVDVVVDAALPREKA
jgi:hypothetical protein